MKRILFSLIAVFALGAFAKAQNVQTHYDLGDDRKMITTTVEMFRPDKMGSTFFFIDMDYGSDASDVDGISLAYWEIARSFKWNESQKFEPRVEYNGGFGRGTATLPTGDKLDYHYSINSAWLIGGQYTWNNADFSKVFTLQANFKTIKDSEDASFQITGVWGLHFFNRKVSFTGFADFWKEEMTWGNETTDFVFLTEPQLWYNVCDKFSVGTEIEISSNFGGNKGSMVNPTLAAKWTF
jgi:hypothetical protein